MKLQQYRFLLKPAFFIFNLLFSTWLVLKIETISPSDFGKYEYMFQDKDQKLPGKDHKQQIKKLCTDYKAGILDSVTLEKQIDKVLAPPN